MGALRRILGILVMVAGVLGIVISVAGLVGVWMVKPTVVSSASSTIDTLQNSVVTSQEAMVVTGEALGATVGSLDALVIMLDSTATSVEDTMPVMTQVNVLMGENLPAIMQSASDSLDSAQQAAVVMDSTVRSLEAFQLAMGSVPLISGFVEVPAEAYNPEKPMAESLGEVAENLESLPAMFEQIATDMDRADDNLVAVQGSLATMSENVALISSSIGEYELMVGQSQSSVGELEPILTNLQNNLTPILDGVALGLTLFLLWLLAIQVVVLTQGWELYQGTAGRMEGGDEPQQAPEDTLQPA